MNEKEIEDMNLIEMVKDFEEVSSDKTLSPTLEYYYLKTQHVKDLFSNDDDYDNVHDYYDSILFGQSRNLTPLTLFKFSNENLDKMFENLMIEGKRVATVGSSGDQAIYSIFNGAKEVELIDVNFMAKLYTELKIACIKALEFEEFTAVMENISENLPKYYKKLSHYLVGDEKYFFDEAVMENTIKEFGKILNNNEKFGGSKFYKNETDYYKLQDILLDGNYTLKFTMAELDDFSKKLQGKYDLILLSNIVDYHDDLMNKEFLSFVKAVDDLMKNNLTDGGAIQVGSRGYSWDLYKLSKKLKAKLVSIQDAGLSGHHSSSFYLKNKGKYNEVIKDQPKQKTDKFM